MKKALLAAAFIAVALGAGISAKASNTKDLGNGPVADCSLNWEWGCSW